MKRSIALVALLGAALLADPRPVQAEKFYDDLALVDKALRTNPNNVPSVALESCMSRRNIAVRLYEWGHTERAERGLAFCKSTLGVRPPPAPKPVAAGPTMEEIQARAAKELEKALALEPDVAKGLEIYRECALCHGAEGFGLRNGSVPQLAGQHRSVLIKQLADIRAGNRDAVLMVPYASVESIGGAQAVADVAGYIDTLEIGVGGGKGPGEDLELGASLYAENCVSCHGTAGEGDAEANVPRIQAQHYKYLVRQFEWIRDGKRRNSNAEMVAQIRGFDERQVRAVLDYVSRLAPPEEFQAPEGWQNPDFAK